MIRTSILVRIAGLAIGLPCAGLAAYGAFEAQWKQDGLSYLTLAAPVVVLAAAFIPPIAERLWVDQKGKSAFLWLCMVPVAALAFYGAWERVHDIKAKGQAERLALQGAVARAETTLSEAREALRTAEGDAKEAKKLKQCKVECIEKWDADTANKRQAVTDAEAKVTAAQAVSTEEAPNRAPLWLLPLCQDLLGFGGLWIGLAPRRRKAQQGKANASSAKPKRKPSTKKAPSVAEKARKALRATANDNVVMFPGRPAA